MAEQTKKQRLLGEIAAFNTILERYPKLLTWEIGNGIETTFSAISFLMDILRMFGITEESIIEWLVKLISGTNENGVEKGILFAINEAIKALLIAYLNGMYDCPIDPVLPDNFLKSPYGESGTGNPTNEFKSGFSIPVDEIDAFGLLQNVPTSKNGSIFYFDTSGLTPSTVYASTDMNAYLWYVINRSNVNGVQGGDSRLIWDNRNTYGFIFNNEENTGGKEQQKVFVDESCKDSPIRFVRGIGPKWEIIYCTFKESADESDGTNPIALLNNTNCLTVYGVSDRYKRTEIIPLNKTIYQFNFDYISSLKLFDTRTLVANVVNALLGISMSFSVKFSLEKNIVAKKVEDLVEQIMNEPEESDSQFEDYFVFSDEKYSQIVNDATLRYNSQYETGNEEGDLEDIDYEQITDAIAMISPSLNQQETEQAVMSALLGVSDILARSGYVDEDDKYTFRIGIITGFIKEVVVQLCMQLLTPKVMLIFAINNRFLNGETKDFASSIENFFKNFWNVIKACIKKITSMIMEALLDMVIGQIKPIIELIIKKLLMESLMYYRILLEQILLNCMIVPSITLNPLFQYGALAIDNVDYADIIPTETTPKQ